MRSSRARFRVHKRRGEVPSPFTSELIFQFTAAHLYEWDEPKRSDRQPAGSIFSDLSLDPLLRGDAPGDWLDPQAIGRVENRLRYHGMPPRTVDEMAERLRLLGDMTTDELSGPMAAFLAELEADGRAVSIVLAGAQEPARFILAEERALQAFPGGRAVTGAVQFPESRELSSELSRWSPEARLRPPRPLPAMESRSTIVRRFLQTHALIGLTDLTARYPIPAVEAAELLELWCEEGKVVRIGEDGRTGESRWAERGNLTEIRRATVAARRRESLAVQPEVFADFLLRRQYVHPATRGRGREQPSSACSSNCKDMARRRRSWENEILPRRVKGYRSAWLDEVLAQGNWFWRAEGRGRDEPRVAFFTRDFPGCVADAGQLEDLTANEAAVLDLLDRHGASFAVDLARLSGLEPSQVRGSLKGFDASRARDERPVRPGASGGRQGARGTFRSRRGAAGGFVASSSRHEGDCSEARRAMVASPCIFSRRRGQPASLGGRPARAIRRADARGRRPRAVGPEVAAARAALVAGGMAGRASPGLFHRGAFGLAVCYRAGCLRACPAGRGDERGMPARSPVRLQSSLATIAESVRRAAVPVQALVMVCAADPANIYGAGAPLDIELLEGGVARLPRGSGNYLILRDGRPVLIIESRGKRLTGLAWAERSDLDRALGFLPSLSGNASPDPQGRNI